MKIEMTLKKTIDVVPGFLICSNNNILIISDYSFCWSQISRIIKLNSDKNLMSRNDKINNILSGLKVIDNIKTKHEVVKQLDFLNLCYDIKYIGLFHDVVSYLFFNNYEISRKITSFIGNTANIYIAAIRLNFEELYCLTCEERQIVLDFVKFNNFKKNKNGI